MELKAGMRLRSVVDRTEVIVVKAPKEPTDLRCGGTTMVPIDLEPATADTALDPAFSQGSLLGKRYAADDVGVELLCIKGGQGALSIGTEVIPMKTAKALPSSD